MSTPAMSYPEYRRHDAVGLAALVRAGEVSASELLATALQRARQVNPLLNAIIRWMDGPAAQRAAGPLSGELAGVPFLLKDLNQDYAGVPTSRGSAAWRRIPATEHADTVRRWLDAGLVVFGKTNTPEFGAKATTEPVAFGPTRNPWALDRSTGGSSGGSAAAVAAGIVPVAGASDGGGSIRVPASCCGLFGLKPTRGLVPAGPRHAELMHGAATHGVISRSVRDTATMLDRVADTTFLTGLDTEPARLRIGFTTDSFTGRPADTHATAAVTATAHALAELGHTVEQAAPAIDGHMLAADFLTIWYARIAAVVAETEAMTGRRRAEIELDTVLAANVGRAIPAPAYVAAHGRWHQHTRTLADFHTHYDLLLTPTVAAVPPRLGTLDPPSWLRTGGRLVRRLGLTRTLVRSGLLDRIARSQLGWAPFTQLANVTGACAASVPTYWTTDGLPVGVQLMAPPGADQTLLRLAAELEVARPWADREPPLETPHQERTTDESVPA